MPKNPDFEPFVFDVSQGTTNVTLRETGEKLCTVVHHGRWDHRVKELGEDYRFRSRITAAWYALGYMEAARECEGVLNKEMP